MKNIVWIVALVVIGVVGYAAAGPYLTIGAIKTGIVENDAELLADNIEFPTLRQNLKEQFNILLMKSAAKEADDNPLGLLLAGLATSLVDGLVDNFVTPSALASAMEGREPPTGSTSSSRSPSTADREDLFRDARMSYDTGLWHFCGPGRVRAGANLRAHGGRARLGAGAGSQGRAPLQDDGCGSPWPRWASRRPRSAGSARS